MLQFLTQHVPLRRELLLACPNAHWQRASSKGQGVLWVVLTVIAEHYHDTPIPPKAVQLLNQLNAEFVEPAKVLVVDGAGVDLLELPDLIESGSGSELGLG